MIMYTHKSVSKYSNVQSSFQSKKSIK